MGMATEKWGHLSTRIIVVAAAAIAVGFAVMIGLIAWQSYSAAVDVGYKLASEQASSYAKDAEGDFNQGFTLPHHLADSILGIKRVAAPDRKLADNMIQQLLDGAPQSVGLWMLWEPNAFDGNDNAFRLDWPRHDPTGRYQPYITKNAQGKAQMDVMMSADRVKEFPSSRITRKPISPTTKNRAGVISTTCPSSAAATPLPSLTLMKCRARWCWKARWPW
jgi:methyl-accepting chemotaxis protein/methyl-accepting chemotaxis protein-2 (aspartate sensor receptor)